MRSTGGVVIAGLLLLGAVAGCTTPGGPTEQACTEAARLVETGFPRQALTVVGSEAADDEPDACEATRKLAEKEKKHAQAELENAVDLSPVVIDGVLRIDHENPGAAAISAALAAAGSQTGPSAAQGCAAASQIVAAGFPRRALTLIGSNVAACSDAVNSAVRAIAAAATSAAAAGELRSTDLDAAHVKADEALRLDQDNLAALQVRAVQAPPAKATGAEQALKSWKSLVAGWLQPVGELLLPAAVVFVALLAVGRLLTPLNRLWRLRRQDWPRKVVQVTGLLLCAFTALCVPVLQTWRPFWNPWWVGLGILALVGVALVACWLATGVRLTVHATDAEGDEDPAAVARTLAFIAELGADAPHGTIVSRGADVTVLDGAGFEAVSATKVVTFVVSAARAVISFAPWTVRISRPSDHLLSCSIQRNGRSVGEAQVDGAQLGLVVDEPVATAASPTTTAPPPTTTPTVHYERLAAAHVLTTMATQYRFVGFEALRGVRSWKSLGLQYVAQTDLDADRDPAIRALSNALDEGHNPNASYALQVRRYRDDPSDSLAFVRSFEDHIPTEEDGPRLRAQRQRMLYTKLAALINAYCVEADDRTAGEIQQTSTALLTSVSRRRSRKVPDLSAEIEPGVAALFHWVQACLPARAKHAGLSGSDGKPPVWHGWLNRTRGALASYQLGCLFATYPKGRKLPPPFVNDPRSPVELAIHHLGLGSEHPKVAAWMAKDPQLTAFTATSDYRKRFNPPPSSELFTLPILARYEVRLKRLGLTRLEDLHEAVTGPNGWLARALDSRPEPFERLCRTVRLANSVPPRLEVVRVELCREIGDRRELAIVDGARAGDPQLAPHLVEAIAKRTNWQAKDAQEKGDRTNDVVVREWLRQLRHGLAD